MRNPVSLLVVDVSESWEETLKSQERGHSIDWDCNSTGKFVPSKFNSDAEVQKLQYPHGSVRAGFNAIIDTARIAFDRKIPTYAVEYDNGWVDGEEQTCFSLQPYIPKTNRYMKYAPSAFSCGLSHRLKADRCEHLMVIGYDRDDCVMATIKDAVAAGIKVVTSEHCMLTTNRYDRQASSLDYFRKHCVFLESLIDVWNYLLEHKPW